MTTCTTTMTLHEAIKKLLIETNRPMTASEIAHALNQLDWYARKAGDQLPGSQISARVNKYPSYFFKRDGQVYLTGWTDRP